MYQCSFCIPLPATHLHCSQTRPHPKQRDLGCPITGKLSPMLPPVNQMSWSAALYQSKLCFGISCVQSLYNVHTAPKVFNWRKPNMTYSNPSATTHRGELTTTKFICLMSEDVCVAFREKKCPCRPFLRQVAKAKSKQSGFDFPLSCVISVLVLSRPGADLQEASEIISASGSWNALQQCWAFQTWTYTGPLHCAAQGEESTSNDCKMLLDHH